jgi:hypothetical protein
MLHHCFGLKTLSKYNDVADIGANPTIADEVGHESYSGEWMAAKEAFRSDSKLHLIKTHDGPEDASAAIFVVRHGWSAVVSYQQYLRSFSSETSSLEEIIAGNAGHFPSWGRMLDLWEPSQRPNTLLLRYEDMSLNPENTVHEIAQFINVAQNRAWQNDFSQLKSLDPRFFRKGQAQPDLSGLTVAQQELFRILHGDWLHRLGYETRSLTSIDDTARFLRETLEVGDRRVTAEVDALGRTTREQAEYIEVLEKERDRLQVLQSDIRKQLEIAQSQTPRLLSEVDRFAGICQSQAGYIALLEKERDRLTGTCQSQTGYIVELEKERDRLAGICQSQTGYIAELEKERDRLTARELDLETAMNRLKTGAQ